MDALLISPVANVAVSANLIKHHFLFGFADGQHQKNGVLLGNIELFPQYFAVDRAEHTAAQPFFPGAQEYGLTGDTMVTAGIYMVARNQALYEVAGLSSNLVALIGAATALFAATIAVAQFDIKRVLAYSTISQLGFMLAAVGIGAQVAGMFHLVTHAFFKA